MSDGRREGDDMSTIAWPGFVDILSSVIIMFVFFVLITATALYVHMITYKSKILQESKVAIKAIEEKKFQLTPAQQAEIEKEVTELQQEVTELNQENTTLKEEIEEMEKATAAFTEKFAQHTEEFKQQDANFSESGDQKLDVKDDGMSIIIFYGKDSITLTKESQESVIQAFEKVAQKINPENLHLAITAAKNPSSPTENMAREIAVARMLNARNAFIDSDLDRQNISVTVKNPKKINGRYDWVKLQFSRDGK